MSLPELSDDGRPSATHQQKDRQTALLNVVSRRAAVRLAAVGLAAVRKIPVRLAAVRSAAVSRYAAMKFAALRLASVRLVVVGASASPETTATKCNANELSASCGPSAQAVRGRAHSAPVSWSEAAALLRWLESSLSSLS